MPITVTSDQTLVNTTGGDAEVITNWTVTAAWSGAPAVSNDVFLQGSNAINARASSATPGTIALYWDHLTTGTANLDLTTTGQHVYFWIKCFSLPSMEKRVRGGIGVSISSTAGVVKVGTDPWAGITDSKTWFVLGSDSDPNSGWVCYVVDPASTPDFSTGTPVMTSVDRIGIRAGALQTVGGGAVKALPVLWDVIRYGTKLTITGSTGTFEDIFAADSTTANQYGILTKTAGIYFGAGKLVFGTTGQGATCVVTDTNQVLVWQDFSVAAGLYEISLAGAASFATTVTLGTFSGGLASGGCTIKGTGLSTQRGIAPVIVSGGTGYTAADILTVSGGTSTTTAQVKVITVSTGVITELRMERAGAYSVVPTGTLTLTGGTGTGATCTMTFTGGSVWTLTANAANQTLSLYGCPLSEMKSAALATTTTMRYCTFTNFGAITTNGALIDNCTFQDVRTTAPISSTYALIVASATQMSTITNSKFINCNIAINITATGTYTFNNLTFSGNTFDIENSSAGLVTINATNGANPVTVTNTGGGTTTINNTKTLQVTVVDKDNVGINLVQVAIYQTSNNTELMNVDTNASGIASVSNYNYTVDTAIYYRVRKSSAAATKYIPVSGTGTITTTGLSVTVTLLVDTNA